MQNKYNCDLTVLDYFSPSERRGEAQLYDSKWWDYKMLHPLEATEKFVEAYVKARQAAFSRRIDKFRAPYVKVLEREHFLECKKNVITGFWRSRRKVDEVGIPYDFWCTHAIKYAERRDWKNMPHPWQLTGTKPKFEDDISMSDYVISQWLESTRTRFHYSTHDYYKSENYRSTPHQSKHQIAILRHIMSKPKSLQTMLIADFAITERLLNHDAVIKMFGENTLNDSILIANEIN